MSSEVVELRRQLLENEQKLELAGKLGSQLLSDKIALQNTLQTCNEDLLKTNEVGGMKFHNEATNLTYFIVDNSFVFTLNWIAKIDSSGL